MKSLESIAEVVSKLHRITVDELRSHNRVSRLSEPRHIFMFLAKREHYSLTEIGEYLNGRDHTTVLHGVSKVRDRIAIQDTVATTIAILQEAIRQLPDVERVWWHNNKAVYIRPTAIATKGYLTL